MKRLFDALAVWFVRTEAHRPRVAYALGVLVVGLLVLKVRDVKGVDPTARPTEPVPSVEEPAVRAPMPWEG